MASEGDIRAGRAFVELFVKTDPAKTKAAVAQAISTSTAATSAAVSRVDAADESGGRLAATMKSIGATIARSMTGIKAIAASAAEGMAKVGEATEHLNQALEKLGPTVTQTGAAIATIAGHTVGVMKALDISFAAFGSSIKSIGATILAFTGPVLVAIAAIAAAVGVAYVAFKIFEPAIKLVWSALKTLATIALFPIVAFYKMSKAVVASVVWMVTLVPKLIGAMVGAVKSAMAFMFRAITAPGKTLVQPLVDAFAWARDKITGSLEAISQGMITVGTKIRTVGLYITGSAAAIVGPLTAAAKKFADFGFEADKGAKKLGVTAAEFLVLEHAAKRMGVSIDDLHKANLGAALNGLAGEANALGLLFSNEDIAVAVQLRTAYDNLKSALLGVALQAGAAVAPTIRDMTERTVAAVKIVVQWVKDNRELIATVFKVASAVAAVGTVITTIGAAIAGAGSLIGTFAAVIGSIGTGLAFMGSVLAAILTPTALLIAALSVGGVAIVSWLNPLTLIKQALGGLSDSMANFRNAATGAVATAMRVFGELRDWVGRVMGGINDAILGGSPEKAFAVAMAAAKVAFVRGMIELRELAGGLGGIFSDLATGNIDGAIQQIKLSLNVAFRESMDYFLPMWTDLENSVDTFLVYLQSQWNKAIEAIATNMRNTIGPDVLGALGLDIGLNSASAFSKNLDLQNDLEKRKAERAAKSGEQSKTNTQELQALIAARDALANTGATTADVRLDALRQELDSAINAAAAIRDNNKVGALPEINATETERKVATAASLTPTFSAAAAEAAGFSGTSDAKDKLLVEAKKQARIAEKQLAITERHLHLMQLWEQAMRHA